MPVEFKHELIIPNEDLPFKLFLFEGKDGNYKRSKHWHRSVEIFLVVSGHLEFLMNNVRIPLHAPDFVIVNPNEVHSIDAPEPNMTIVLQIPISCLSGYIRENDYVVFKQNELTITAGIALTGGTNGEVTGEAHQTFLSKMESYHCNAIGCLTKETAISNLYVEYAKRMRDKQGVKFQVVVYNNAADYEGVINVKNTTEEQETALIYWVTGIIAGCEVNKSNTNKTYDGEFTVVADYTQSQLESSIDAGEFVLHQVGDEIRVLVDINSLVNLTDEKKEEFKSNQTIRVIDQVATDVSSVFNSKYLGKIANNESGRTSLWNDVTTLFKDYQRVQAIENFEDADVSVAIGNDKKSVSIDAKIQVVNAMEKLYMTVVVE